MEIRWKISPGEARRVRDLVRDRRNDAFVLDRVRQNVRGHRPPITRTTVWHMLTMCLLTTQQRSGPDSPVNRLLGARPYPLRISEVERHRDPAAYVARVLRGRRGIRRGVTIGRQLAENLPMFSGPAWRELGALLKTLQSNHGYRQERRVSEYLAANFAGLGPKQSRNLLQSLALTRYEIPIDSRITRWLNESGFPVHLSAVALSDPAYYDFVGDGVRALCQSARVYPCVFDAVIFSMTDESGWEKKMWWARKAAEARSDDGSIRRFRR